MSLIKVIDVYVLWRFKAGILCWVSSVPWFYFFICAIVLQQQKLSRGYGNGVGTLRLDVLAGDLPSARKGGGGRKILMGAPQNLRHHLLWKITWSIGCLVAPSSLVACYILLGQQEVKVVYIWVGFQILWLILRSVFYHVAEGANALNFPILYAESLDKLRAESKKRVLDLMFALARYQMHIHPRGSYSYHDDLLSLEEIEKNPRVISQMHTAFPVDFLDASKTKFHLSFKSVVGDTLLTSAAWLKGSKTTGMELYDSCIVTVGIAETVISTPAVRVLCGLKTGNIDIESMGYSPNSPRGSGNSGQESVQWRYWIPCSDGRWLQACSQGLLIIGDRQVELLTDEELYQGLLLGGWSISLRTVEEVKGVLPFSRDAGELFLEMMTYYLSVSSHSRYLVYVDKAQTIQALRPPMSSPSLKDETDLKTVEVNSGLIKQCDAGITL